jgi:hypothetical protein
VSKTHNKYSKRLTSYAELVAQMVNVSTFTDPVKDALAEAAVSLVNAATVVRDAPLFDKLAQLVNESGLDIDITAIGTTLDEGNISLELLGEVDGHEQEYKMTFDGELNEAALTDFVAAMQ